jgi:hypothetical protein
MTSGPHGYKVLSNAEADDLVAGRAVVATDFPKTEAAPISNSPDNPHAPHIPLTKTAKASSLSRIWNTTFDPYNRTLLRGLYQYDEPSFFRDYEESYKTNPFTFMLVESVITQVLGDGYHFEGPGANVVEEFFWNDDTRTKIEMWYRDTVRYGNGFLDFYVKNGRMVKTRNLRTSDVTVDIDIVQESLTYGERIYYQFGKPLNSDNLCHLMLRPVAGVAYGMSTLRPNLIFLQMLLDCGGDVAAALKRVGYAPIVARLDLDGYRTEEERQQAIEDFRDNMKETESATNNFVIDRRNEVNLLGVGSAGARLLPVNDLLEPWIAVCLRNFGFPIGIFLQQGANKAIVEAQREDVRIVFANLREKLKYTIERFIIPKITNRECRLVWNKPPPSSPETQNSFKLYMLAYQLGILSKEFILDYFDIKDTGKSFFEGALTQGGSHDISSAGVE